MSSSQIQVLAITFLLAAAIVLPLIVIAFRKEAKKRELKIQEERRVQEREQRQRQAEEAAERQKKANQARKEAIEAFHGLEDRFRGIREQAYSSAPCSKCGSGLVLIVDLDVDTGIITGRCAKCGDERRIHAISRESFQAVSTELIPIMRAYNTVQRLVPEYSGLAVSFPQVESRSE